MKKVVVLVLTVICTLSFVACGVSENIVDELAVIIDVSGNIDDRSFNQGVWEASKQYAGENGIGIKHYKSVEKSTDSYLESISLAVKNGAKIVLCSGYYFEQAVFIAQDTYPDTKFIVIECGPNNGDGNLSISDNTYAMFYAEEQSGFLAGYSAVKEGYTNLGFIGGVATPPVIRFGYGFIQGAEYAAIELGLGKDAIEMKYTYLGNFDSGPENQALASSWYNDGTQIIFAAAGNAGNSVMSAAQAVKGKIIGVDVDQSYESDTVITSALKEIKTSTYSAIESYYNGEFKGGTSEIFDITDNGIGLAMENSRFENFTNDDYKKIYNILATNQDGILDNILDHTAGEKPTDLKTSKVKIRQIK